MTFHASRTGHPLPVLLGNMGNVEVVDTAGKRPNGMRNHGIDVSDSSYHACVHSASKMPEAIQLC